MEEGVVKAPIMIPMYPANSFAEGSEIKFILQQFPKIQAEADQLKKEVEKIEKERSLLENEVKEAEKNGCKPPLN